MTRTQIPGAFSCPLPKLDYDTIQLAHGSGGRLSAELIETIFLPCFGNTYLDKLEDQAILPQQDGKLAFTTDSFVVSPVVFPGGDIGELAINGTVNDLAMSGATPLYLSAGFILEEGLPIADLHHIVISMKNASDRAGVQIVTGDTKVVNKGKCDKLFINTSGVGRIPGDINLGLSQITPGDQIILSGTIADHGMAVMTVREGLSFFSHIRSDTAALNGLVSAMLTSGALLKAMRDPTRGGVGTTLNEFARSTGLGMYIYENRLPVREDVRGACELLGIDPLYVANEGKLIAVVDPGHRDRLVTAMQGHEFGRDAVVIGEVTRENGGLVVMQNTLGVDRIIDLPVGEQLPRIC